MSNIKEQDKNLDNLPDLNLNQYDHWRDWSFNLQLAHTEIEGIPDSNLFGRALFSVGQRMISELREGRSKDGEPYIIHTDVKSTNKFCRMPPPLNAKKHLSLLFLNNLGVGCLVRQNKKGNIIPLQFWL